MNYHDRPELSSSQVAAFLRDPIEWYHLHVIRDWKKDDPTPDMKLGTAVHRMIELGGPDHVRKTIPAEVLNDQGHCKGKAWLDWKAANPADEYVKPGEEDRLGLIWQHLMANSACRRWIEHGEAEREIFWTHEPTGIRCRSRIDLVIPGVLFVDWKTTPTADLDWFVSEIHRAKYDVRAAFYRQAIRSEFGQELPAVLVAIQKTRGYGICEVELDETWLRTASDYLDRVLIEIAEFDIQRALDRPVVTARLPKYAKFDIPSCVEV